MRKKTNKDKGLGRSILHEIAEQRKLQLILGTSQDHLVTRLAPSAVADLRRALCDDAAPETTDEFARRWPRLFGMPWVVDANVEPYRVAVCVAETSTQDAGREESE